MENLKLTELLRTFAPSELKEFEQFLKSPYFVKGRNLLSYYKFLIKYHPDYKISKETFAKKFFKEKNYSEEKKYKLLKTYNWELLKFAEEYISVTVFRHNKFSFNEILLHDFMKRKLGKRAEEIYNFLVNYQNTLTGDHFKYVNFIFAINAGITAKRLTGKGNETFDLFRLEAENLLHFFLHHSKYLLGCVTVHKGQYNSDNPSENITGFLKNINLEKYIEEYAGDEENKKIQKMAIYNILILLYPEKFDKYFTIVKQLFEENITQFRKEDSLNYITLLLNFLSRNYDKRHGRMMFEIINFALENGVYYESVPEGINFIAFSTALYTALNLGEIKWAENYVENNILRIIPQYQTNMKLFAMASIEHYKGNYEISLEHISYYKMFDEVINYKMRELQIKNYYKLTGKNPEYMETLISAIDAFKHYLNESKKLTDKRYNTGVNFLDGLNLLINYNYSESDKKKSDAIFNMKNFKPTAKNEWVMNEINSILNI